MCPRSGFWYRGTFLPVMGVLGTPAKTTLLETTLFANPQIFISRALIQGPPTGGVSGVSRSGLVPPFLSFFVLGLSRFVQDFPDSLGDGPGNIFLIRPFSLSRPIKSTYEEQSRKGPRHNLDISRGKWETPRFGNPPV